MNIIQVGIAHNISALDFIFKFNKIEVFIIVVKCLVFFITSK